MGQARLKELGRECVKITLKKHSGSLLTKRLVLHESSREINRYHEVVVGVGTRSSRRHSTSPSTPLRSSAEKLLRAFTSRQSNSPTHSSECGKLCFRTLPHLPGWGALLVTAVYTALFLSGKPWLTCARLRSLASRPRRRLCCGPGRTSAAPCAPEPSAAAARPAASAPSAGP